MSERVADERKTDVLRLRYVEGLSTRAIAVKLSMSRRTVRALLGERRAPKPPRVSTPRDSILAPFEAELRARLASDRQLRAPAMLEHLRLLGYRGGISVLRERMRQLSPRPHIDVFSSFTDIRPAERVEVDWAHFGYWIPGVPREVSVFVAVLVYSRMMYIEFVMSRAMGSFSALYGQGVHTFFGGLTAVDVFDCMKTVVVGRAGGKPIFAPRFVEFARARGFAISATLPRTPTGKPFVERTIGFVRTRFTPGRRFRPPVLEETVGGDAGGAPVVVALRDDLEGEARLSVVHGDRTPLRTTTRAEQRDGHDRFHASVLRYRRATVANSAMIDLFSSMR